MQSNVFWSSDAEGRRNTAADSETDLQGDFLNCPSVQYRHEKMPGSQPELLFHKILPLVLNKGWLISIFFISVLNKGGTGKKSPSISPISHWFLFRANDSETDLFYLSHWFLLTAAESETGTDLCFSPPSHLVAATNQECSHTTGMKWSSVCFKFLDEMSPWNYVKTVG